MKLERYNKVNYITERNGGIDMSSDAMLRLYNVTSGATDNYGSEIWSLNRQQSQRVDVVQMIFISSLVGITR
jgi:hypothetical protein